MGLFTLGMLVGALMGSPAEVNDSLTYVMDACVEEDTTADVCYWDADSRGNGQGSSFVVLNGAVLYL